MALPTIETQNAIYTVLQANDALLALVTGIFDPGHIPENQAFPYVTAAFPVSSVMADTMDKQAMITMYQIDTWDEPSQTATDTVGMYNVEAILSQIDSSLHRQALAIAGYAHIFTLRESHHIIVDPDGLTVHGIGRYRVYTEG